MATVKNTIKLQDKMTPVLRSIIKSLNTTVNVMAGVDKVSNSAFHRMQRDVQAASDALDNFNRDVDEISPAANQVANSFSRWKNPLVTAASAIYTIKAALQGVSRVTDIADTFTLTTTRLDLMNDGLQTTGELQNMILASAQRSRAEYGATAAAVSKLGILAKDAFTSTEEIVAFTELMNKSFKIGGAGIQEQTSAMYQLTQAMAAGKLQGDEFRSIMENAPMLAEAIAKFTGKSKGELKEMSSEGLITADIIKGAMFAAAKDINTKFETMPKTFGDIWTEVKNMTLKAFQPIIERVNAFINSPAFDQFAQNIVNGLIWISNVALDVIEVLGQIMAWVQENGPVIADIAIGVLTGIAVAYTAARVAAALYAFAQGAVNTQLLILNARLVLAAAMVAAAVYLWQNFGVAGKILAVILGVLAGVIVAATIAQHAFNASLWACPLVWIIALIVAVIAIIAVLVLWIMDLWQTNMDFKYGIIKIWNSILNFFDQVPIFFQMVGNGIADAFGWAKVKVLEILQGMANGAIKIINDLIGMLNKIPGVAIDPIQELTFATTAAAEEEAAKQARADRLQAARDAAAAKAAERDAKMAADRAADEAALAKKRAKAEAAKQAAQDILLEGGLEKYLSQIPEEFDWDKYMKNIDNLNIAGGDLDSVGKIKDDVSITDEDIKLLKDVAATEFVNKYTTLRPEMTVTFGDVRETADVGKILEVIEDMVEEAYASVLVGEGA